MAICCSLAFLQAFMTRANAQTASENGIRLAVVAESQESVPETALTYLKDKLMQIVTSNGIGNGGNSRFVITASVVPTTIDHTAGPPAQVAENLNITLYIADCMEKNIFSTVTFNVKAVDNSEEKALIRGIRSVNINSPKIADFIKTGKGKIMAYYEAECDNILAQAKSLASVKKYEQALYELSCIPECCSGAFAKCSTVAAQIFAEYADFHGSACLSRAKAAWSAEPDASGAAKAGEYLCQILPFSASYTEAVKMYEEMRKQVRTDLDFNLRVLDSAFSLEENRINAWKEVGVAYGSNQQPVDYDVKWLVR